MSLGMDKEVARVIGNGQESGLCHWEWTGKWPVSLGWTGKWPVPLGMKGKWPVPLGMDREVARVLPGAGDTPSVCSLRGTSLG